MDQLAYVADASLGAVPVNKLFYLRSQMQAGKSLGSGNPIASDRPVLTGSQQLQPNVLYPSSNNPNVRYYLPQYRLAADGTAPKVELRFGGRTDGVGQLTVELAWDPPAAQPGIELRALDHQAQLELRFVTPVQGSAGAPAGQAPNSIPLQPLQRQSGNLAQSVTVFSDKDQFNSVYQAIRDGDRQAKLSLRITAKVGVRTWRQVTVGGNPSRTDQVDALMRRGALLTRVLNPETLATAAAPPAGAGSVRLTLKPPDPAEAQRVGTARLLMSQPESASPFRRALTSPSGAALQPTVASSPMFRAMAAQPAPAPAPTPPPAAPAAAVSPAAMRAVSPILRMARPAVMADRPVAAQPGVASPSGPAPAAAAPAAAVQPVPARFSPVNLSAATLTLVNRPAFATAVAASDLRVKAVTALPVQIALGTNGQPAILDTELDAEQSLSFHFDPRANPDVFAVEGYEPKGPHLLLALLLNVNGSPRTVYQDNMMQEVVYVAPSEFRLGRDADTPFLPGISFLPADFGTTGGNTNEAELLLQMVINYRLEPWIDPDLIEAARAELARHGLIARFTPILPREAKLSLDLDALGADQQRDKAVVDPDTGITDTISLDNDVFTRVWRERLAQPGAGIRGRVRYQLFDGSVAESPVVLSFWGTATDVLDIDFIGAAEQPRAYTVNVRNKIESPVTIERLPAAAVGSGAMATPVNPGGYLNRRLQPQEVVQINYQVTPPDTPVVSIVPLVYGTVEPNLTLLLRALMLSPGFKSLSFTVPVSAAEGVFGTTQGSEALTGLLVEFDDGSRAQLSAAAPAAQVTLVGRLVDQILGKADDQHRYLYRVTNLHTSGEGARGNWREGQGVAPLQIGAVTQLDF